MRLRNSSKKNNRKKKKSSQIIVTGAAGFIGNSLVKKLLKNNYKVISVDTKDPKIIHKNHLFFKKKVEDFFKKRLFNISAIIHLAAESRNDLSMNNPDIVLRTNVISTLSILEKIKNKKIFLFFAGTNQVEIDKKNLLYSPYSISKFSCEELIKFYGYRYNLNFCILKFSEIFSFFHNPKKKALSIFIKKLKKNNNILINNKEHKFDFLPLEAVIKTILNILKNATKSSSIVKFKTKKIAIINLIKLLKKNIKSKSKIIVKKKKLNKSFITKIISINKKLIFKNNLNTIINYV